MGGVGVAVLNGCVRWGGCSCFRWARLLGWVWFRWVVGVVIWMGGSYLGECSYLDAGVGVAFGWVWLLGLVWG